MFGIVINKDGYKVAFVCLDEEGNILYYTLNTDEQLITTDWQIANTMGKPRWTGTEWIDEEPPEQVDICPTETDVEKIARLENTVHELMDMIIMMSQQ